MSYISTDRRKNVHFYTVRCRTAAKMWGCCVLQAILSIPPPTLTWLRTEVRVEFYTAAVWQDHHLNFVCWCQDIMRFWIIQEKIYKLRKCWWIKCMQRYKVTTILHTEKWSNKIHTGRNKRVYASESVHRSRKWKLIWNFYVASCKTCKKAKTSSYGSSYVNSKNKKTCTDAQHLRNMAAHLDCKQETEAT